MEFKKIKNGLKQEVFECKNCKGTIVLYFNGAIVEKILGGTMITVNSIACDRCDTEYEIIPDKKKDNYNSEPILDAIAGVLLIIIIIILISQAQADTTITIANNFSVKWYSCKFDLVSHSCKVDIQNLNSTSGRDFNLQLFFSNTSYKVNKTTAVIFEWKALPTEIPTYSVRLVNRTCYTSDNITNTTTPYDCSYNETYQNGTIVKQLAQWKSSKALLTKEGAKLKAGYGMINIPKFDSKPKLDDFGNIETMNGTKTFLIEWTIPVIKNDYGWGSSGKVAFMDNLSGEEYHPWWNISWYTRYNISINNTESIAHVNEIMMINISSTVCDDSEALRNSTRLIYNDVDNVIFEPDNSSFNILYVILNYTINARSTSNITLYCNSTINEAMNQTLFLVRDDFERKKTWTILNGDTPTTKEIISTVSKQGSNSLNYSGGGNGDGRYALLDPVGTSLETFTNLYVRGSSLTTIYMPNIFGVTAGSGGANFDGGNTYIASMGNANGNVNWTNKNNTGLDDKFYNYTQGRWDTFRFYYIAGSTNRISLYINNSLIMNSKGFRQFFSSNVKGFYVGGWSAGLDYGQYDNIFVSTINSSLYETPAIITIENYESVTNPSISISLNTPTNNSYTNNRNINFTHTPSTDNLNNFTNTSLWTNISGTFSMTQLNQTGVINGSLNGINVTLSYEGVLIWNIQAYTNEVLYHSNFSSANRTLTIDTINPSISYIAPTEANNTFWSGNFIAINVSASDINEANITFYLYNSSTMLNSTNLTIGTRGINFTGLSDGVYYYNVTIRDMAGNSNTTETRNIILDSTYPFVNLSSPVNGTSSTGTSYNLTYNVSDTNIQNCELWDDYPSGTFQFVNSIYNLTISSGTNNFSRNYGLGTWTWNIRCFDMAGNFNFSANNFTFTVQSTGGSTGSRGGGGETIIEVINITKSPFTLMPRFSNESGDFPQAISFSEDSEEQIYLLRNNRNEELLISIQVLGYDIPREPKSNQKIYTGALINVSKTKFRLGIGVEDYPLKIISRIPPNIKGIFDVKILVSTKHYTEIIYGTITAKRDKGVMHPWNDIGFEGAFLGSYYYLQVWHVITIITTMLITLSILKVFPRRTVYVR